MFIRISTKQPVPTGIHVSARAIHEFRHRACSAQVADLHLPLAVHVAVLSRYRGLQRPAFSWLRPATSISPATFFLFACILPEAWARFWRALGSSPKN